MEFASLGFRFALAYLFLGAGISKLFRRGEFEEAVSKYELLPRRLLRPVAASLPWVEVTLAVTLGIGLAISAVSWTLATLLLVFAGAVAINLARGRTIDCGCFTGAAPTRITWSTVARNTILAAMAATVALVSPATLSVLPLASASGETVQPDRALAVLLSATMTMACAQVLLESSRVWRSAGALARRLVWGGG